MFMYELFKETPRIQHPKNKSFKKLYFYIIEKRCQLKEILLMTNEDKHII